MLEAATPTTIVRFMKNFQVWEARPSGLPKDGRVLFELEQRGARETLEERTIWITHGQDLVNVQSFYLVADTVEIAKVEWFTLVNV